MDLFQRNSWFDEITPVMKYDVMCRDHFRCVFCEISASDGHNLFVEHIIPLSEGGETDFDNLRTVCGKCLREKY